MFTLLFVLKGVHGLNHRQVIELLLRKQPVLKLTTIELSQTTIKRGGRKRSTSLSKRIGKRSSFRHHKRTVSNQSSGGAEERTRKSSIIRRYSIKRSTSPRCVRRTNSLKRTSSNVERGTSGSRRLHSSMIVSSSQSSSPSSSPGGSGTQLARPGETVLSEVNNCKYIYCKDYKTSCYYYNIFLWCWRLSLFILFFFI